MSDEGKDKVETERVQFRTSTDNFDTAVGCDMDMKEDAARRARKEHDEGLYLNDMTLTAMKLGYVNQIDDGVDISIISQLVRKDREAKEFISENLFDKLDFSNGERGPRYNTRIVAEDAGIINTYENKYFYKPNNDTVIMFGQFLMIDELELLDDYRYKNKRNIIKAKDYKMNVPLYFEDSIEGILNAITTEEISGGKAHIYVKFLNNIVVKKNSYMIKYITKYREEINNCLKTLSSFKSIKDDKVALERIGEMAQYL